MSLLVVLSSLIVAYSVNAVDRKGSLNTSKKKYTLAFNNTYDSSGKKLRANDNVDGSDIKKGYAMAQSYISPSATYVNVDGKIVTASNNVYCLNMGNHPYSNGKDAMDGDGKDAWDKYSDLQKTAIQNILALGFEGNLKGNSTGSFKRPNYTRTAKKNNSVVHLTYKNTKYDNGKETFSDSEIYIATQLLVWEITQKYRLTSSLYKTKVRLADGFSNNKNIQTVYNYISNRIATVNKIPSFTVDDSNLSKIKTYNFKVTKNNNKFSVSPTKRILKDNKNGVLKHYSDLRKNVSYAIKVTSSVTKYLNITASISGNKLILEPQVTDTAKYSIAKNNSGNEYSSVEKDLSVGNKANDISANVIVYSPNNDAKAQNQIGVTRDKCVIDPQDAHFKISVTYNDKTEYDRDFSIKKDMRIKSETIATGVKPDDISLDKTEEGYYYYVTLPDTSLVKNNSYYYISPNSDNLIANKFESQNASDVLKLSKNNSDGTFKPYYNAKLDEYYVIVGPTNSEGETEAVSTFISKYMKQGINKENMPYGNYYIYELGKMLEPEDGVMNPENYALPNNVESYNFTYKDHYNTRYDEKTHTIKNLKFKSLKAKDISGKEVNCYYPILAERVGVSTGSLEYFNRLKRIYRAQLAINSASPTNVNLISIPVRIHKSSQDGIIGNVVFKVEKKVNGTWQTFDITDYIADKMYIEDYDIKSLKGVEPEKGLLMTYNEKYSHASSLGYYRETGYTPHLNLPIGEYRFTEQGNYDKNTGEIKFREYNIKPDPIEINIGDNLDDLSEFIENGDITYEVYNKCKIQLRLLKQGLNGEPLEGAVYQLFNENGNIIGELTTDVDGVAYANDLVINTKYYVQEIEAPAGYLCDDTIYEVYPTIDYLSNPDGSYRTVYNMTRNDEPIEFPVTKVNEDGEPLANAEFELRSSGQLIDSWKTNDKPYVMQKLIAGQIYTLSETVVPNGYLKADNVTFKVSDDGKSIYLQDSNGNFTDETKSVEIKVVDKATYYVFNKVDEDGKPLENAVLELIDTNKGQIIEEWITDGKEHIIKGKLVVGNTYILREKSVPNNEYEFAKDITFTVENNSEKHVITMKDNYKRGSVTIHKIDAEGNVLTGAEFELYKSDNTKVTSTITKDGLYTVGGNTDIYKVDSNGTFKVDKLRFGDYYFIETKAPEGRTPYAGKIEFSIKDDNTLNLQLTVKDDYSIYPNTGGSGYNFPIILAISSIAISIGLLIFIKKKSKTKETEQ